MRILSKTGHTERLFFLRCPWVGVAFWAFDIAAPMNRGGIFCCPVNAKEETFVKHYIFEPAASAILGSEGAPVTGYEPGLLSEKLFDGQPFSRVTLMATCTNGETSTVSVRGSIEGLTPQRVQETMRTLNFVKVKFSGLTLEARADKYNTLNYIGTAEKAEIVTAVPTPGVKSS